jgi:hypothetical protein
MGINRPDLRLFVLAVLLTVSLNVSLGLLVSFVASRVMDGLYLGLLLTFVPVMSIVAGWVFLRWRVQTDRWAVLGLLFVVASLATGIVLFFLVALITGDSL